MIEIGNVIISLDIFKENFFVTCQLCRESVVLKEMQERPVEQDEVEELNEVLPIIWDDLSDAEKGYREARCIYNDIDGDIVTSLVGRKDCVFTCYDEEGICYCAIEKAYREGKTSFINLFHVTCILHVLIKSGSYEFANYHRWHVCSGALCKGNKENMPLYKFLEAP